MYDFPTRVEDCTLIMSSYLRFCMPQECLNTFDDIFVTRKKFKPHQLTFLMLQVAYYELQKQNIDNPKKLHEYHKQVTEIIPQKMKDVGKNDRFRTERVDLIIRSMLHVYGQNKWHQAWSLIERLFDEYAHGFWIYDEITEQWGIDIHGLSNEVIVFGLRYVFVKHRDFILSLPYDFRIIVGRKLHTQGHQRSRKHSAKSVVAHEICSWEPTLSMHNVDKTSPKDGFLSIQKVNICSFYANLVDEKQFINQKTDSLQLFVENWSDVVN